MGNRFVTVFLQIGHEGCPAGADVRRIIHIVLTLGVDVTPGVLQMGRAKERNPVHTGVIRVA